MARDGSSSGSRWSALPDNFSALRHRDFRLFWFGALVSFFGTWIQNVGQGWLVYELTGSETLLGLLTLITNGPMMVLTPVGGWLADRYDKKLILTMTQSALALTALTLSMAVFGGFASFGLIAVLAALSGVAAAIDIPTRHTMISSIVPPEDLANAIPLNSATFNLARLVGPAIGGFLLEQFGAGTCYFINGISFLALISALHMIQADVKPNHRGGGTMLNNLAEGFLYVWQRRDFRLLALMVFVAAFFGMFFISLLPAVAKSKFNLGGNGLGMLMSSTGVGAVVGLLGLAALSRLPRRGLVLVLAMFGIGLGSIGLALSAQPYQAMFALALLGMSGSAFLSGANAVYQALSGPEIRGRVISVHIWVVAAANPIGSFVFGRVSERNGLEFAFALGGSVVVAVAVGVYLFSKSIRALSTA
ncbi:MAG: MFS transporter [Armatimonadota bacterium]